MPDTPDTPHLGDTLATGRAGRVDADTGATQGGTASHERPSFSDPITRERSDLGSAADRVPGAASTTPEPTDTWTEEVRPAPMRGSGAPQRPGDAGRA